MKKITFLLLILLFILSGCKQTDINTNTPTKDTSTVEYIDPLQFTFTSGDGEVAKQISKNSFTKPIEITYNGKIITIDTPKFTGIPVNSVYSYKKNYQFIDGYVIFDVATDDGLTYFKVDKNGKTIAINNDYKKITEGRDLDKYMGEILEAAKSISSGRLIGNNVVIEQFGEPGSYVQYLYSVDGERLSEGYDSISYFFNGLALTVKDKKVGLIDENGNEILTPSISFDTIIYPPKNKGYSLNFMFEDAFVIPIDGEFAIINIIRSSSNSKNPYKDKKLSFENLWEENFATEPIGSTNRIKELSTNKNLITESKALYDKNADIEFR